MKNILKIYFLSLIFFTLFRVALILSNIDQWEGVSADLLKAFLIGAKFDTVIICYILALPSLLWLIFYCINKKSIILNKGLFIYCFVFFTLTFAISAIDIPYFKQFFTRFDKSAFLWASSPKFVLGMIAQDFKLWGYFVLFIILLILFYIGLKLIFKNINQTKLSEKPLWIKIVSSVVFLFFIFIGIRGRLELKSPIRVGVAYFSNNAFLNKIGLNPNFTLLDSLLKKDQKWEDLVPTDKAFEFVKNEFKIENVNAEKSISQTIFPSVENYRKPNIVIVLMESMTTDNMKYFGNQKGLTPFLDKLAQESIFFENAYSEGIHTFNGVYGTLFSFPALWNQHPMKIINRYDAYPKILNENGYVTNFFLTHDGQFDNMEGFLYGNDIQHVYSQKDYPFSEIHSNLGVTDDYLFRFGINKMNAIYQSGKPFFCTFLTASNHLPYVIPDYFKSTLTDEHEKVIQYSDWAIQQFLKDAEKQPWFKNTIFVFLGDHGAGFDKTYEMSLSYNHIPIMFYAPYLFNKSEIRKDFIKQIDVFPSIMGLTDIKHTKNNLGVNIWNQNREFAYFSADDKVGVINDDYFLIYNKDGSEALYRYRIKDKKNYALENPEIVKKMKEYAFSHLQTAHVIKNNLK